MTAVAGAVAETISGMSPLEFCLFKNEWAFHVFLLKFYYFKLVFSHL